MEGQTCVPASAALHAVISRRSTPWRRNTSAPQIMTDPTNSTRWYHLWEEGGRGRESRGDTTIEALFGDVCCFNGTNSGYDTIRFLTADTAQERAMMIPICELQTRAQSEDLQISLATCLQKQIVVQEEVAEELHRNDQRKERSSR